MKSQIRVRWIMHVVVVAGIFAGAASSMVAADRAEGEPPSALGPVTYDYVANPGLAIPDNDPVGIRHTIYVPDSFFICGGDVDVDLGITHTWIGDLIIRVEHDGIQQEIWNRACGNTDNINSTADDQGSVTSCSAIAGGPINGVFWSPQFTNGGPLSVFRGDAQGNWTIEVIDAAGQDVGTLNQWSLHFHAPIECIPPPSGMVSWWPGEPGCGARDRLGRNDGTPHGAPTCPVDPKVGRGALGGFDSATQTYFSVPHTSSLSFGQGGLSVDLWVKTSSDGPLLEKGISSGPGFSFGIGSGKLYFSACDTSICIAPITSSATVSTGSWRHVAMTWGGPQGGIALYVDGQPDGASGAVLTTLDNVQALLIGASGPPGAPTAFFTGEMDEIEIFNRVLGDGEILELAEADCAGKCKCVQPPDNMIAWWPLDEVSGSIVRDLKSGNDGAPQPGPIGGAGNPAPVNGFVDGALDFDGTNFVRVPSAPSLNLGTSDFTIDAWVYYDAQSNPSYGRTLVAKHSDIGDGFQLMLLPGNFHLHMGPGAGLMFFGYCPTPDDAWSHYAVTVDQGKPNGIKYYLNGVLAGMQKTPDRVYDLGGNLDLFVATRAASLTYGAPLSGSVDELEIFRRALSADEIAAIYRASADG